HPLLRRPSAEEAPRHRNLDVYVLGLPMKLRDAGTRVHPEVLVEEVRGRAAHGIDVSYPGGGHSWRFHFDAETGALVRARFYTAGGSLDEGEWFDAEGEIETAAGLRIPSRRTWYISGEDTLIGTQEILELERID
ncbi:MAG TPA: hypothetical protein VM737_11605, partial [Gemmatimonadota bacterium]|nr:hypothetical protein [Gemmatimonadota bacterium]